MKEITDKIRLQLKEVESLNLILYLLTVARAIGSCVMIIKGPPRGPPSLLD